MILKPTCFLSSPRRYGLGDHLMVDPLLSGLMTHVPAGKAAETDSATPLTPVDFCYVENGAHAHAVAVEAVARESRFGEEAGGGEAGVGGRTFNITNEEADDVLNHWNRLVLVVAALCCPLSPSTAPFPCHYPSSTFPRSQTSPPALFLFLSPPLSPAAVNIRSCPRYMHVLTRSLLCCIILTLTSHCAYPAPIPPFHRPAP